MNSSIPRVKKLKTGLIYTAEGQLTDEALQACTMTGITPNEIAHK